MEAEGFRVLEPKDDQLFVDIDTEEQWAMHEKNWPIFVRNIEKIYGKAPTREISASRSGLPGRHVVIQVPGTVDPVERCALQGALGSDPTRELLSLMRLARNEPMPTLFVEKP